MSLLPNPLILDYQRARRRQLVELAVKAAPQHGYNATALPNVRILRNETELHNIPVLYKPGAVFVLQGDKRGVLNSEVYRYDEEHYLAVAVPVPFRMHSTATPDRPLLAVYVEFDMQMAAEIAMQVEAHGEPASVKPRGLASSRISADLEDILLRLLLALRSPVELAVLGPALLRELHFRVLIGPQGGAMIAALRQQGIAGRVVQSLAWLRENYGADISIANLAKEAGMSVPSYHVHFKDLTGSSPMQYVKALRLHEARLMIARRTSTIAQVASRVGYLSPAQFSRDFKRHFGRTASEEMHWIRRHLGEIVQG